MRLTRSNDDPTLLADLERLAGRSADDAVDPAGATDTPAEDATGVDDRPRRLVDRVVRRNDDAVLLSDLERLAQADGAGAAGVAAATSTVATTGAAGADDPVASALDDGFIRRFVRVVFHVRRYAPFYAGGLFWLAAITLIQPYGHHLDQKSTSADLAAATIPRRPAATKVRPVPAATAAPAAAPAFDYPGGSGVSSNATTFDFTDTSSDSSASTPSGSDTYSTFAGSSSTTGDGTVTFPDDFSSDAPEPLSILASGYASATGGTPLEQDPGKGGLPVFATGGNETKRSYVKLGGDELELRLQEDTASAVRSDAATIKLCAMPAAWTPSRGAALSSAPAFDPNTCSTGVRNGTGLWTFDLSPFGPLADGFGFALTPGAGTASTFQVVFLPAPVPAAAGA